ncbi:hypothetical protein [Nitrolancea hollandica]|nr:hypothetical protein [Nitrolancea hollandica]
MKRVTLLIVGLLMAATLVLAGCGQQPEPVDTTTDEPKQAGTSSTQPAQETIASTSGPLRIPSEHGGFMVIVHRDDGPTVNVNFDDPTARDTYFAANRERIAALLADPPGNPIEVKVTFQKPVEWEQFVALRDDVGLQPWSYTFAEISPEGQKWALDHSVVPDDELIASAHREADYAGVCLLGMMVVEGTIPISAEGLGKLAADPRVLLADTTSVEAMQILEEHGIPVPSIDDGPDVHIPSPYWGLDWLPEK